LLRGYSFEILKLKLKARGAKLSGKVIVIGRPPVSDLFAQKEESYFSIKNAHAAVEYSRKIVGAA
jgi:hypothetical protein